MVVRNDLFNDLMSPPVGIPGGFRRAKVRIVFQNRLFYGILANDDSVVILFGEQKLNAL